jgi:tetratricopeptide (TPR) repeat protein
MGRLTDAVTYQQRAMRLHRASAGRYDQAGTLVNLAETLHLLGRRDEALASVGEALAIYAELRHPPMEANALTSLALIHRDSGDIDEAAVAARQARDMLAEADDDVGAIGAQHALATIAAALGDTLTAERHFDEALRRAGTINLRHPEAEVRVSYAGALCGQGRLDEALDQARQALGLARVAGYALIEAKAHTVLADVFAALGRPGETAEHARRALGLHRQTGHRRGEQLARDILCRARSGLAAATDAAVPLPAAGPASS